MDKPITLCDRCDIWARCCLVYDGNACRRNRTVEPTNADKIRSMTDEELAYLLVHNPWMREESALDWLECPAGGAGV